MPIRERITSTLLSLMGATIGGTVGYYLFFWISRQGFYAMIAPGALMGLGCGLMARHRSMIRGILCGIAALILAVYTEWKFAPFLANDSLNYMATHLPDLPPIKLVMMSLGTLIAFWLGKDGGYGGTYPRFGSNKP